MNAEDEKHRADFLDALTKANVDARSLAVEVVDGALVVAGSVPDPSNLDKVKEIVVTGRYGPVARMDIRIEKVKPIDSPDGRGRSPITGTSEASAHESRHQTDPD